MGFGIFVFWGTVSRNMLISYFCNLCFFWDCLKEYAHFVAYGLWCFCFLGTVSNVLLSRPWLLVSRIQKHVKFHVQLHMHVHVHILAYACTCTHTHRQQYEQYHTDSLDIRKTLTYQNLLFCRVPINSILGFIIRTYKKVGFGSLR